MSWNELLAARKVDRHRPSKDELDALRAAIDRDLRDAALAGLSADNRFGLAYEAALLTAKIAVHAAGYRVRTGPGFHRTTWEALAGVLAPRHAARVDFFEFCRRRRNDLSYEAAGVVTDREADEILVQARELLATAEAWILDKHPPLARTQPRGRRRTGQPPRRRA